MTRKGRTALLIAALFVTPVASGQEAEGNRDIATAITSGDADLAFRYRYEFVDQDSFGDDANASTLRVRLNYETGVWQAFSGFVEFDHVFEVLLNDFNSGAGTSGPDRNRYPVVADPKGSDLNQIYLQYAPDEDWRVRVGRQRINLDDQRYVGGVGWRQNEQTFDSVSVRYLGFRDTTIFYSYVDNVNRIFGNEVPDGDHEQNTHLLNGSVKLSDAWTVVGYAYLIDNDDAPAFSTNTFGVRVNGNIKFGDDSLALLGEVATQSDAGNNPASFDAEYFRIQGIWSVGSLGLGAGIGFESLGSDNAQGFRTPLATLHPHNGWADQFLATPPGGLEDLSLRFSYTYRAWDFILRYHDFSAESGGADYGSEIDLSAGRSFGDQYGLLLKLAAFDADDPPFVDTTKLWVMLTASF